MAGTSRIDELRKKFDENPRRYFAPLANEYRKIGDFDQAIFICQEFLPQQPGHMSGHIVYGQALFESGRHDEARSVFETALALDPENLIALRHLGDIARAQGDTETASAWYRRVLESDPRNEEIAGILNSLESDVAASDAEAPATTTNETPEGVAEGDLAVESAISFATGSPEPGATESADPIVTDPLTTAPAESSFDDIAKLFTSAAPSASAPPPSTPSPGEEGLDLIHEGEDVVGGVQGRPEEPPLLSVREESRVAEHEAAAPREAPENPTPSFSLPFLEGLTPAHQSATPSAPEPEPPPPVAETAPAPSRAPAPDASTAFVTETMAELYIKQGHHDQALDVYRQLVQLHPEDAALAARLQAFQASLAPAEEPAPVPSESAVEAIAEAGPTIREFLGAIASFRLRSGEMSADGSTESPAAPIPEAPPEPPRAAPSGGATVGGSLHELFTGAEKEVQSGHAPAADLAIEPNAESAAPHSAPLTGRPSKPAATELSLDHVFRHATPAAGNMSHSSFSFDQFFSEQAQQDVAPPETEAGAAESAGSGDDIQQFNAWLEGLKKS